MTSRERLQKTLEHKETDRVPMDLGGTIVSGINASTLIDLRKALKLKNITIKVQDPYFMIGKVDDDVIDTIKADVVGAYLPYTKLGYRNENWKEWIFPDGKKGLVGGNFNVTLDNEGNILAYPGGDTSADPSAMMPKSGHYFDAIVRQGDISDDVLDAKNDFKYHCGIYPQEDMRALEKQVDNYYKNTEYGIIGNFIGTSLGDFSSLPGPNLKETPGIRNIQDWLIAHLINQDYIKEVFEYQTDIAMKNLIQYKQAVGDKIQAIYVSGTDFGTQDGGLISVQTFRDIYKPFFTKINTWIHENTNWKTFYHSCGSVVDFLDDFVDMGVDILNPVQCSAKGMDAKKLKEKYGDKLVFWGGGIDTQKTLPFGTPEDVKKEALERLEIFSKDGGYVFNAIHNIQNAPVGNLCAMLEAYYEFNNMKG